MKSNLFIKIIFTCVAVLGIAGQVQAINSTSEGFQVNLNTSRTINEWSVCKIVQNANNSGIGLFVPTKTSNEWVDYFIGNISDVPNVSLLNCGGPTPTPVPPTPIPTPGPNPVNGSCGPSNNSCWSGSYSDRPDSSTQYLWNCNGINGGTSASCSAPKPPSSTPPPPTPPPATPPPSVNGSCGSSTNSCNSGSFSDAPDSSTQYLWNCNGINGGSNASCSVDKPPVCAPNNGQPCTKSNACTTTTGTYDCSGACNAPEPAPAPGNLGQSCSSAPNSCGQTNPGTIQCNGSCSATTPSDPANLGSACNSAPNSCGQTSPGAIQCDGSCSASTPSNPAGYGDPCSPSNACGTNNGAIGCNGACSVSAPYCKAGCTDPSASNYCPDCNLDDGSCNYPPAECVIYGPISWGGNCVGGNTMRIPSGSEAYVPAERCNFGACYGHLRYLCTNGSFTTLEEVCMPGAMP